MADEALPTNAVAIFIRNHFDQLLKLDHWAAEVIAGSPPGFTLSAYAYDASTRGRRWALFWLPIIDKLAWWVWRQRDHCRVTFELQQAALQSSLAPAAYAG